ncbi:hypothetical protein TSUD_397500 [Trifolium subterraneum]|uniref:Zinc finger PMZ-type domain-containing protein n=1 Tax=Trifolium subterraneum TaxID=3900 RepID=A0A2Z6N9N6_TRISU|nr:hypothetical protein TSUD_397500 [Trifolium subterraneum]
MTSLNVDLKPKVGMSFENLNGAYEFWRAYSKGVGFGVRKRSDPGDPFVGNHRAQTRTDCKARISLGYKIRKFVIHEFVEDYNHPLQYPETTHMLASHRKITEVQACEIDLAEDSGLRKKSTFQLMSTHAGHRANLGFTKLDVNNYISAKRKKRMVHGEVGCLLQYFQRKLLENPSFFHAYQVDAEEKITNVFWCDANMVLDYGYFGDVLSLDTTYCTNDANRPLALFSGFNHYKGSVIFGAALMYDEIIESFKWLFDTFLQAHNNKKPRTVFTDQAQAMARALAEVMPETHHGLCTWHLMQNGIKRLGNLMKGGSYFLRDLKRCVYEFDDETIFEKAWTDLVNDYKVHDCNWIKSVYAIKKKWASCYMKEAFTLGMRSTQVSESLNAHFKSCMKPNMDITQFFKHFEQVVEEKRGKELSCEYEYESSHKLASCKKFDTFGILCSHALKVFEANDVKVVPEKYILRRWTREARCGIVKDFRGNEVEGDPKLSRTRMFRQVVSKFIRAATDASSSEECLEIVDNSVDVMYDLVEKDHKDDLRVGLSVNLNKEKEFNLKELHTRDRTIKYLRVNVAEVNELMRILHTYEQASSQEFNLVKSEVFISRNMSHAAKEDLSRILGVKLVLGTGIYLGLPSMVGRSKKAIFSYIKDRIWKRINSWRGRALSKAGGGLGVGIIFVLCMILGCVGVLISGCPRLNQQDVAERILDTPLVSSVREDKVVWEEERNGCYSVKFGYKLAMRYIIGSDKYHVAGNWNGIWKAQAPHKARHLLWRLCRGCLPTRYRLLERRVECTLNCPVCDEEIEDEIHIFFSNKSSDTVGRVAMLLWCIWHNRNDKLWNDNIQMPSQIGRYAFDAWNDWYSVHKLQSNSVSGTTEVDLVRWEKPALGWVKYNVDVAFVSGSGRTSVGLCFRDSSGQFMAGMTQWQQTVISSVEGEAWALLLAMEEARHRGMDRVQFESDSKVLIDVIHMKRRGNSEFLSIVHDILDFMSSFLNFEVKFVKRQANSVAHTLARAANSWSCFHRFENIPLCIEHLVFNEMQ